MSRFDSLLPLFLLGVLVSLSCTREGVAFVPHLPVLHEKTHVTSSSLPFESPPLSGQINKRSTSLYARHDVKQEVSYLQKPKRRFKKGQAGGRRRRKVFTLNNNVAEKQQQGLKLPAWLGVLGVPLFLAAFPAGLGIVGVSLLTASIMFSVWLGIVGVQLMASMFFLPAWLGVVGVPLLAAWIILKTILSSYESDNVNY